MVSQKDKTFIPRVVVVPVGSRVDFRNDDDFYHNVFSLSEPQKFDTGLYAGGLLYSQTFSKPGPVELLCNIHASMVGYVMVVDTPYYAQPRTNGAFVLRNIPPGRYELSTWHEASTRTVKQQHRGPARAAPEASPSRSRRTGCRSSSCPTNTASPASPSWATETTSQE